MLLKSSKFLFKQTTKCLNLCQANFSVSSFLNAKIAVVLSGSGVYDGSEIHETSACLVHLSRNKADVAVFAPDKDQMHVINHLKGAPSENETRNVLVESARIARGKAQALKGLKTSIFDAVIFPGGFGAAKNLSTFAVDGVDMKVDEEVERVIREFHLEKKPIGLCCIAPILAAKILKGCEITLGKNLEGDVNWPHSGACVAAEALGAKHVDKHVDEVHVDTKNLLVTTPAYMYEAYPHEVYDGVGLLVNKLLQLVEKK